MMRVFAPFFLSAVLCLASFGVAMARVQGALSWQITVCTGEGMVEVTLDASGTPVQRSHHCPDCLAMVALGLPPVVQALPPHFAPPQARAFVEAGAAPGLDQPSPKAQGPPGTV